MKKCVIALMMVLMVSTIANAELINADVLFDFEDGGAGGVTVDAASGVVATIRPTGAVSLEARGNVLTGTGAYIPTYQEPTSLFPQWESFTISFWVDATANIESQWQQLLGHCEGGIGPRFFTMNSSSVADFQTDESGWDPSFNWHGTDWATDLGPNGDGWHNLTLVYDSTEEGEITYTDPETFEEITETVYGFARAYRDGVLDTVRYKGGYIWTQGSAPFTMGSDSLWKLDDVAIVHGTALSETQVMDIVTGDSTFVPEPCTLALLGLGITLVRKRK
jgi:hypothetical protein